MRSFFLSGVIELFYVYVLRSETTGRRYTGSCHDVAVRLREHNAGQSKSTRASRPWVLIHTEEFTTRAQAVRRELYLKTGAGRDDVERQLR